METKQLSIEGREVTGRRGVQRLRREGFIPAVVYGEQGGAHPVAFSLADYRRFVRGTATTQLFRFQCNDAALNGTMVLIKEIQVEPVRQEVLHIDFMRISKDHRITVSVPIDVVGEAPAVKIEDCILNQSAREIEIECLPLEIPAVLTVDVSNLHAGESIHAGEIVLPPNVRLRSDPSLSIVSAIHKKEEVITPAPTAAVEGAAVPEGAAPAAGAAPTSAPAAGAKAAPAKEEKGKK